MIPRGVRDAGAPLRTLWYRSRATRARRRGGRLALIVLLGAVGGLAIGALAGARRTQSSFSAFLASTNPSAVDVAGGSFDPAAESSIARLPHVTRVESAASVNVLPLGPDGEPRPGLTSGDANGTASIDGLLLDMDRATVVHGRMAVATRPDEAMMAAADARFLGWHVGDLIHLGFYTNDALDSPGFGTARVPPALRVDVRLVGTVVFNNAVVQDDIDTTSHYGFVFTPALASRLLGCCANSGAVGVRVDRTGDIAAVEAEIQRLAGGAATSYSPTGIIGPKADLAIKPDAIALVVFGAIAALAALLIAAQLIAREVQGDADDRRVLRALGADPAAIAGDGLPGTLAAVVVGSVLAAGVAVALSPLTPIGPVRPVEPGAELAFDWTVLGLGPTLLIALLATTAVILGIRGQPHRAARRGLRTEGRRSRIARAAASAGLPQPAVTGFVFALEPGEGRTAVPVRSAIIGAALATGVLAATLAFGASLHTLVSHPALYGWNWDVELAAGQGTGAGDIPAQQAARLLDGDRDVGAWAGVYFGSLSLDGVQVPVLGVGVNAAVGPPILAGRAAAADDEVVLGASTLARLHARLGDHVEVSDGVDAPTSLRIVGTATLPAIGGGGGPHLEMGTGALVPYALIPAAERNPFDNPVTGPNAILVRFRAGSSPAAAQASVAKIAGATSTGPNFGVSVVGVQRPAEIVNYRTMGSAPAVLGVGLATGAVAALGLTLVASVRRRRRDLAVLKTLGFTRAQLATVVAWQSTVTVVLGGVVGATLGIALGRMLWDLFAGDIDVVAHPTVPALSLLAVGGAALVLANLVAAVPGRIAARTPTALALRAE